MFGDALLYRANHDPATADVEHGRGQAHTAASDRATVGPEGTPFDHTGRARTGWPKTAPRG